MTSWASCSFTAKAALSCRAGFGTVISQHLGVVGHDDHPVVSLGEQHSQHLCHQRELAGQSLPVLRHLSAARTPIVERSGREELSAPLQAL